MCVFATAKLLVYMSMSSIIVKQCIIVLLFSSEEFVHCGLLTGLPWSETIGVYRLV